MAKEFRKFTIIRDTREQNGLDWDLNIYGEHCDGIFDTKLDTGDYSILGLEQTFVIERKATVAEIAKNVIEDRFVRELQRLAEFKSAHIILQAELNDVLKYPYGANSGIPKNRQREIKMSGKFILKKIIEYQKKYGVHIWFAGFSGAEELAMALFKQAFYGKD